MTRLLIATRNRHKTREIAAMLGDRYAVEDLTGHADLPEIEETGETFFDNATLKAQGISRVLAERGEDALVMADDSGLEVDALDGAPGVRSARYSGEGATDERNLALLLENMAGQTNRAARFRCVIALARGGELLASFNGTCEGTLTEAARGRDGFGYDPIFTPEGYDATFAEIAPEEKNRISHRARAMTLARNWLANEAS